jgi:hypothetical protein
MKRLGEMEWGKFKHQTTYWRTCSDTADENIWHEKPKNSLYRSFYLSKLSAAP